MASGSNAGGGGGPRGGRTAGRGRQSAAKLRSKDIAKQYTRSAEDPF